MTAKYVKIPLEDAERIFDLAVDSPLVCSGSFETDDVKVLRRFAATIGADPAKATPDEFVRDYPHTFRPGPAEVVYERQWFRETRGDVGGASKVSSTRPETDEELAARVRVPLAELQRVVCVAGSYGRRCGRPEDDPIHATEETR